MNIKDLITHNRSYRRFNEAHTINRKDMIDMIDAARLSASARNMQPLKYFISCEKNLNETIFPTLAWAGYLPDWSGPKEGERPSAYIIQLHDTNFDGSYFCDDGIAAQSILLTAVEKGLGGCIFGSVKKEELAKKLQLPTHLKILHVIAIGKPIEKVIVDEIKDGNVKYWRDENNVHHVPKRSLSELIIN